MLGHQLVGTPRSGRRGAVADAVVDLDRMAVDATQVVVDVVDRRDRALAASGNVTAPVSSLIIPNTYGEPVAFLGVPKTSLPVDAELPPLEPAAGCSNCELLELLEPQPAASSPAAAIAATALSHRERFIVASLLVVDVSGSAPTAVSPR